MLLFNWIRSFFNSSVQQTAITRAKIVQKEIIRLRESLKNGHHEGKLLASYDAELGRLCQVPGVMAALLDNTKV